MVICSGNPPLTYKMEQEKIDFQQFREDYSLPATKARIILKALGYEVVREGINQYIVGSNQYGVSNAIYLKHAVFEFRSTKDVVNTRLGNFIEFRDVEGNKLLIDDIDKNAVEPIYPELAAKPKKQPKNLLVPIDKGRAVEIEISQRTAPPAAGGDALQILVAALTEAQKAAQPPETLHPQRNLLEAETQGFLLTTEQLGQLLGMSKGTISSKKSGFKKLGFQFEKVKEGNTTLWKVKRY